MEEDEIKMLLLENFYKWADTNLWYKETIEEEDVKKYLGYFGVNRR